MKLYLSFWSCHGGLWEVLKLVCECSWMYGRSNVCHLQSGLQVGPVPVRKGGIWGRRDVFCHGKWGEAGVSVHLYCVSSFWTPAPDWAAEVGDAITALALPLNHSAFTWNWSSVCLDCWPLKVGTFGMGHCKADSRECIKVFVSAQGRRCSARCFGKAGKHGFLQDLQWRTVAYILYSDTSAVVWWLLPQSSILDFGGVLNLQECED